GAVVLGPKPEFSPSMRDFAKCNSEVRQLANRMWASPAGGWHPYGKGHVASDYVLGEVLLQEPAFECVCHNEAPSIVCTHRRHGDADIYFVANRQRRAEDALCSFRVDGKRPEFWFPETGEIREAAMYSCSNGRVSVPMHLEPAESVFVVFHSLAFATLSESL